jgi:hypothetical protein
MLEAMSPASQMIKANRGLPEGARFNMVLLEFADPLPARGLVQEFYRLHLTPGMFSQGEERFYQAEVYQPQHARRRHCVRCRGLTVQVGLWVVQCENPRCLLKGRPQSIKPARGVVQVLVPGDRLVRVDGRELCRSVVLVLDRRYPEQVLASVYRTAGMICDAMGWRLAK